MVLGRDLGNKARLFRLEDLALAGKQPLAPDVELLTDTDRVCLRKSHRPAFDAADGRFTNTQSLAKFPLANAAQGRPQLLYAFIQSTHLPSLAS